MSRSRLELLEVFRRPPRQLGVGRNYVKKSSRPSSSILRLPGHQRFKPLPAYKKSGEARGANHPQHPPTPFTLKCAVVDESADSARGDAFRTAHLHPASAPGLVMSHALLLVLGAELHIQVLRSTNRVLTARRVSLDAALPCFSHDETDATHR